MKFIILEIFYETLYEEGVRTIRPQVPHYFFVGFAIGVLTSPTVNIEMGRREVNPANSPRPLGEAPLQIFHLLQIAKVKQEHRDLIFLPFFLLNI